MVQYKMGRGIEKKKLGKKAVALRYAPEKDQAPRVVAKGKGKIAERIIEEAEKEGIHIEEDPDLVEALSKIDWYEEIPPQLYTAIAEILAFTYRLNKRVKDMGGDTG